MKNVYKYSIMAVTAAVVLTAAAGSSFAIPSKYLFTGPKKVLHKSTTRPAHKIINRPGKREGDFAGLNNK